MKSSQPNQIIRDLQDKFTKHSTLEDNVLSLRLLEYM